MSAATPGAAWRDDERSARAAWSRLAEPGDATAGALVRALGAVEALDWVAQVLGADGSRATRGGAPRSAASGSASGPAAEPDGAGSVGAGSVGGWPVGAGLVGGGPVGARRVAEPARVPARALAR